MKLLITGGTTFVSKYTAEYFAKRGDEVFVLNRGSKKQIPGVNLIKCDRAALGSKLKGECFDAVIDVVAYSDGDIKSLIESGVRFDDYIFISSSAVYPEYERQPFSEDASIGYNSVWKNYGANKVKAENYLLDRVPNAYILRPPYLYGKYENLYRAPFVFDCAIQDRPFYIPQNGDMKLQFFSVYDLCRFMEILLDRHPKNRVFNVGNSETVSIREWVELCYSVVGKKASYVSVEKSVPQRDYFPFYDYEYVLDVSRQNEIMSETLSLIEGLKEEYEWYKDNKNDITNRKPYIEFIGGNMKL